MRSVLSVRSGSRVFETTLRVQVWVKASVLLIGLHPLQVALDLINPQLVLPNVIPHLQPGAVCAVYLAKCVLYFSSRKPRVHRDAPHSLLA